MTCSLTFYSGEQKGLLKNLYNINKTVAEMLN